ncbi:hypothetical protein PHYSODRAFT_496088 [Phytophthora sojae]|uniref:Uncharacterized protein n=1 Tax=Phytophthora sojae (strain P6497) TaxID=1094619 RepID=G4Z2Y9_PHYSP|nr:hypothetical protein PHYSODRAFT_496088 [Phytophthora sojae]EGZ19322.1 hypothetical protein PHYSODRAFT_496088 [Phytophthora sojae]|eukprot:XP_009522039.1 hypothetical protein PHYSODRAFT_496088 [Phytophthora sojae]
MYSRSARGVNKLARILRWNRQRSPWMIKMSSLRKSSKISRNRNSVSFLPGSRSANGLPSRCRLCSATHSWCRSTFRANSTVFPSSGIHDGKYGTRPALLDSLLELHVHV